MATNYFNNYPNNNNKPKPKPAKATPLPPANNFSSSKDKEVLREIQMIYSLFPKDSHFRKKAEKKFKKLSRDDGDFVH